MDRLAKNRHRGMLLMHDNHPWTAAMVPMLLKRLKAEGYRVVHMTAAVPEAARPRRRRLAGPPRPSG